MVEMCNGMCSVVALSVSATTGLLAFGLCHVVLLEN